MENFLEYEVHPCDHVPQGLPRQRLEVLSPIWRGESLRLKYPDGAVHTLQGRSGPGEGGPCELQVFWTRHQPQAPAVCLALGGDLGLRDLGPAGADTAPKGYPFLALAESLIPPEVLAVIGPPPPPREARAIRLLV
ncbi:MAG: hypothetical protein AB1424_18260 [Thermodesulfobacteriota bacterium]